MSWSVALEEAVKRFRKECGEIRYGQVSLTAIFYNGRVARVEHGKVENVRTDDDRGGNHG
jgi:hypothetical protein